MIANHMQQVFEVWHAQAIDEGKWLVHGRTYETISIGDIIYAHEEKTDSHVPLTISDILFFGRKLDLSETSSGDTPELIIEGHGEVLNQVKFLYTQQITE